MWQQGVVWTKQLSRSPKFWFRLSVFTALYLSLLLRINYASRTLPYCQHYDEHLWTKVTVDILQTSDLNPHRFTKPSVMAYLNTAGMALGSLRAASRKGETYSVDEFNKGGYPYYSSPTAIMTLRQIYALISVVSMLLATWCLRRFTGSRIIALTALIIMALSPQYFLYSWSYLNVDILGVFSATLAVSYAYLRAPSSGIYASTAIMGVLGGLTLGTKYNLFWIAIPLMFQIYQISKNRLLERVALFFLCYVGTFLVTTPFAVLDVNAFVAASSKEVRHYASGNRGAWTQPGLPMLLKYLGDYVSNYGLVAILMGAFGLVRAIMRDWRGAFVIFAYPFLLQAYMAGQRTYFNRNLLIMHLALPMLIAFGAWEIWRLLCVAWVKRRKVSPTLLQRAAIFGAVSIIGLSTVDWQYLKKRYDPQVESRNEVARWLTKKAPAGSTVLIPEEIAMHTAELRETFKVAEYESRKAKFSDLAKSHPGAYVVIPRMKSKKDRVQGTSGTPLARFGRKDLHTQLLRERWGSWVTFGNPKLAVYKLDPK